ncbi:MULTISPECIES: hypothetical protein [unclassified Acinetobacter]|uniref:hypothetical protein n=1 Tax=unclassified Acinetobacter TaxID=196816 RepID=UPI0022AC3F4C|nr:MULTISPECIES: hypothetical protein [unclassified Acinetobacter]WAU72971.1 hypothetical protein O1450_12880 [Acinetobacter sp. TR11]WAU76065.1 hypothetical protein O1449_12395 [Acinetobacter sp. TR3]
MNIRSLGANTRTSQSQIIEHTPVHDPVAYQLRQKQLLNRKKLLDTLGFLAFVFTALILLKV